MRKSICLLLSVLVILSSIAFLGTTNVSALQDRSYNFYSVDLTENAASNMSIIAKAQNGRTQGSIGYTEAWCADFVSDCARIAGQTEAIPPNSLVSSLYTAVINAGGYTVGSAITGDLVFYKNPNTGGWMHVGIMIDSNNAISGNYWLYNYSQVAQHGYNSYWDETGARCSAIFVRPNYKSENTYIDLGTDFFALIMNKAIWKPLTIEQNCNVDIRSEKSDLCADQVWKFERQSDGSYKIISTANGYCMEVAFGSAERLANVLVAKDNGESNQRWYIYGDASTNRFVLKAKCTDCVLDVNYGGSSDGTNVQMDLRYDGYPQIFDFYRLGNCAFAANLGEDFTAPLLNKKAWVTLQNDNTENVSIQRETGKSRDLWRFIRQVDGSYKIYSCYDGKCLDLLNALHEKGTNVQMCSENSSNAQRWYFFEYDGGYIIQSKESGKFIDVTDGNYSAGSNIQVWDKNCSDSQIFAVYRGNECEIKSPNLSANVNDLTVTFDWNDVYGETYYILKIWKNNLDNNEPCFLEKVLESETKNCDIELPNGNYEAVLQAQNYYITKDSNSIKFSVSRVFETGDTNFDGRVDITDATAIQKYLANIVDFDDEQLAVADTNGDGSVSIADATQIQKYLAQLIPSLG